MTITAADERFMRLAIETMRAGVNAGQSPFGACVVRGETVLSHEHNGVWAATDITAHAEVTAIRSACRTLGSIRLAGATMYSTCEPCPMCFSACHWARVERVVFGARIADAQRCGFNELQISAETMRRLGESPIELVGECLRSEVLVQMDDWVRRFPRLAY